MAALKADHPALPNLGPRLRKLREARDETIEQAAVRMGIGYWSLLHLERRGRVPGLAMLLLLAEGYGVEPGDLLSDDGDAA